MNIQNVTGEFGKYFAIHTAKNKTKEMNDELFEARKNNQALDSFLYEYDKAKIFDDLFKVDELAKKLARGEKLSEEERQFLAENDPNKLKEAEDAKERVEEIKEQLKNAKTKQEKEAIVQGAMTEVTASLENESSSYGEFLMESLKEVLQGESEEGISSEAKNEYKRIENYIQYKKDTEHVYKA